MNEPYRNSDYPIGVEFDAGEPRIEETTSSQPRTDLDPEVCDLTIVIPTYRRLPALRRCLESVLASALPRNAEIVVVCNGADSATEEYLDGLSALESRLLVIRLPRSSPAVARNIAMARSHGQIIYNLDDDVTVTPQLFSRTLDIFAKWPSVDVVGGPNLTPLASPRFEKCVGAVLASPFGSATLRDRSRSVGRLRFTDDRSLITCNLAIRRRALAAPGEAFRVELISNEENVLLGQLALEGREMLHDPELIVYHERRGTLRKVISQFLKYGRGRWQNTTILPGSLSTVHVIPVLFLVYLLSLGFLRSRWWLAPLGIYLALLTVFSAFEALRMRSVRSLLHLAMLFPVGHIAYGAGFLGQMLMSAAARVWGAASVTSTGRLSTDR